ncbi:2-succinyl-5-enolpyruvyl-6-hydroxy-3-cyclohexene-1-carboxylic-acid synthase [Phycicoccus sp. HDW14]|uniref:2-succinyl-5-enolpyruvyl-6-hydroxy-3- cyclohexene-1-carboxylic-acid synthase n=1 Tax=Phycicoccus sp. HDW14 TaxID=2714941 RepID=UPI00140B01D7|nr:2-succinyl-5-enolpyruvyl-6-hydroxy-3-cyclohexene-1-carboxylic-acid synthase [Phycicoccus sp. HDW14]QIM19923.1 2-succinyl-5-enolpyruvyl-6-hydroxy-3-cyclohexene-1-carboxylic-acid synthase [Phycicoccus sp. HDW14]
MTPSSALASVLVDELVRGGVRDVVLAPGSRSAPFAYALLDAESAGRLRLHVRVDERSAGFLALGLAKGSGRPVAVVTTSGTAVANLHPAVLEAHHAAVPLLVLSADRPHELRGTGANQTTQQPGIFGGAVRWSADLPAPVVRPGLGPFWRSTVCRALTAATGSTGARPGPVHLDVCLREPLVPDAAGAGEPWPDPLDGRPDGAPWVRVDRATPPAAEPLEDVGRTLVVVGSLGDPRVGLDAVAWAEARGHPVVAEPFGPAAVREAAVAHGPLVLTAGDWLDAHAPERVVVVGRVTLARGVGALLRRPGLRVEVVSEGDAWPDPSHVAAAVHPVGVLRAAAETARTDEDDAWAGRWWQAGAALAEAVAAQPSPWGTGLAVAEAISASVPHGAVVVVGSSNPVRDLDLGVAHSVAEEVLGNRGLAGIDGLVSTAIGVALTRAEPVYALLGDLTFLHDANGLLLGPDEPRPDLTVVVVNDDGGGIFTTLEPGAPERSASFERAFGTPTGTDLASLCAAHGVGHVRVDSAAALADEVGREPEGLRVVEVRVDRSGHRQAHADLRALAARALTPPD